MDFSNPPLGLFSIVFLFLLYTKSAEALNQEGFISIDCGYEGSSGYKDNITGLNYTGDAGYIATGEKRASSSSLYGSMYATIRMFPNGTRNCYSLSPVEPGKRYLVRAEFYFDNYDGTGVSPVFDLYLGVNFWKTIGIRTDRAALAEIITLARRNEIHVCLVNTGRGTPFISLLELRPFLHFMYPVVNESQSLVTSVRVDYGARNALRYPNDQYDRKWDGDVGEFLPLNTSRQVQTRRGDLFQVPSVVLQTARTFSQRNAQLTITGAAGSPGQRAYIVMHFSELSLLNPSNESRVLEIYGGNGPLQLFSDYSPPFLEADHKEIYDASFSQASEYRIVIGVKNTSTQPFLINAIEGFIITLMNESETNDRDVAAIENVREAFKVTRNWESDPCSPRQYIWQGVGCSYEASADARITSLNLSFSGLSGAIPSSIRNLTALTTPDLSGNNLIGPIPDVLGDLPSLKILDVSGNGAIGSIPQSLCDRVSKGILSLRGGEPPCKSSGKSSQTMIIAVSVVVSVIFLMILTFLWICLRRRKATSSKVSRLGGNAAKATEGDARQRGIQFKFSEIKHITRNFELEIGKGGFGPVYLGHLNDETKVAVKVLSSTSSHGLNEFMAEIILLGRVHHKNLVCLLGYCDAPQHLSLVYEYMENGNIQQHLQGAIPGGSLLNWRQRVSIALQAAQGLDYLHSGCRPPIVHRDIKSNNILLTSGYVAKIADFGLSRAFSNDNATHISTGVAGTPGYLDPEYFESGRLDEKSDVYSFGIVLLEILTGQPPYIGTTEKIHIVKWVRARVASGDIDAIVDPRLQGDYDSDEAWKIAEVAMSCTATSPAERMSMGDVVTHLKQTVEIKRPDLSPGPAYSATSSVTPLISGQYTTSAPSAR